MLTLTDVDAFYGKSQVLDGVSLRVDEGETVALLGRNGAGKSTTLKAVMGLVRSTGDIALGDVRLSGRPSFQTVRTGVAYVPEDRSIFTNLTVQENLEISVRPRADWTVEDAFTRFPQLAARRRNRGDRLSGGEQQMLAIARALLAGPRIVLLDEPSEGLAPVIVEQVSEIVREMQERGLAVLLVEQRIDLCLRLARRVYVLESGRIVYDGTAAEFRDADEVRDRYLALRKA